MVFERGKKPFILFFVLYLVKFQLIWTVVAILISYLICSRDGDWSFIQHILSWIKDMPLDCCIGVMPVIAPAVYYYQCFSMVNKITIDEKEKLLQIDYRPFFFGNKTRTYQLDNPNFYCEISVGKINFFTKLFLPHCSTILTLCYSSGDNRVPIYIKDTCGWERDRIMDVYQTLKKYTDSDAPHTVKTIS